MDNQAMFKLGYGLYVLTVKGGKDNGCIINTVMQVTAQPLRILVAVNKSNLTHDIMQYTKEFNVSVLTEQAPFELFRHFGFQSGKDVEKFADYENCARSKNGIFYITESTNAYISGRVTDTIDCGTHTLFLAEVTDSQVLGEGRSVTYDYYHRHIKPQPEEAPGKKGWRCKICGYIYEGEELPADFICPLCKHGAADFEPL